MTDLGSYGGEQVTEGEVTVTATLTRSNVVVEAIKETLLAYLGDFMPLPTGFGADSIHKQSGIAEMKAAHAPAIWIDDKGADDKDPGAPPDFAMLHTYAIDIEIWDKYGDSENARAGMNLWRDAVQACLNEHWDLGCPTRALNCDATKGDPAADVGGVASDVLWVCTVRATVEVMAASGSETL